MVLVYGLAVAPVLHAVVGHGPGAVRERVEHTHEAPPGGHVEHAHGDAGHGHGKGPGQHEHAPGSVEHLWAVATAQAELLAPTPVWVALRAVKERAPLRQPGERLRPTAMPQGP